MNSAVMRAISPPFHRPEIQFLREAKQYASLPHAGLPPPNHFKDGSLSGFDGIRAPRDGSWLDQFVATWAAAENSLQAKVRKIAPEYRGLVETQVLVQKLGLTTEIVSRGIDTVASTLRRVQQSAAG